jgi:glycosyltransferase involved in cell wall biosynthesis
MQNRLMPKVSIMIPTYNQDSFVGQAIESALMQDYKYLEIVVADDCSSDATTSIVGKYLADSRIVYIRNINNLGRVGNYSNTLFQHVKGEWVVNLDGDDYYTDKSFISNAISDILCTRQKNIDVVAYMANQNIRLITKWIPECKYINDTTLYCSGKGYFQEYVRAGSFEHMSCIYNVAIARRLGGYVFDFVASDFHALMKLFLQGSIVLSSKNVGVWRVHGTNASTNNLRHKFIYANTMYDDMVRYATLYFTNDELSLWKREMQDGAYDDYIMSLCAYASKKNDFIRLLKDFRFRRVYITALFFLIKRAFKTICGK